MHDVAAAIEDDGVRNVLQVERAGQPVGPVVIDRERQVVAPQKRLTLRASWSMETASTRPPCLAISAWSASSSGSSRRQGAHQVAQKLMTTTSPSSEAIGTRVPSRATQFVPGERGARPRPGRRLRHPQRAAATSSAASAEQRRAHGSNPVHARLLYLYWAPSSTQRLKSARSRSVSAGAVGCEPMPAREPRPRT